MKATGVVRKLDELGRIVLPIELRRTMGIGEKDPLEIFVNGEDIVLRKYKPGCSLCGSVENIGGTIAAGKLICDMCVKDIVTAAKGR